MTCENCKNLFLSHYTPVALLVFFAIFYTNNLFAAVFKRITLNNGSVIQGELIELYEDRWFFEKDTHQVQKYILLFENESNNPRFYLKNMDEVKKIESLGFAPSQYFDLLNSRIISLASDLVKDQAILTGNEGHHKYEKMFGNFAWDIGILDENKKQHTGNGNKLRDYYIFSKPVMSPINGKIVGMESSHNDNPPVPKLMGDLTNKKGNYLTIQIDDLFYLSIVHFQKDSIKLKVGDKVKKGDILGRVGNSGISYVPHLHYTLYIFDNKLNRFISVPGNPSGHHSYCRNIFKN